MSRKTSHGWRN